MCFDSNTQYKTTYDLLSEAVAVLKGCGYDSVDIQDFLLDATASDNMHLVEMCLSYTSECMPQSDGCFVSSNDETIDYPSCCLDLE